MIVEALKSETATLRIELSIMNLCGTGGPFVSFYMGSRAGTRTGREK